MLILPGELQRGKKEQNPCGGFQYPHKVSCGIAKTDQTICSQQLLVISFNGMRISLDGIKVLYRPDLSNPAQYDLLRDITTD